MAKNIRQYDILISCPSDVQEELEIIRDTVENFNKIFGDANNVRLNVKHWSKDSYPQSGGKPQPLLNKQFILECDAAIAVFWTRFGTPTEEYGSGSEEEIEKLVEQGKQVFVYFSDAQINPSNINSEQYERVKAFRKKYENGKGIHGSYACRDDFKKKLLNHLSLYFLKIFNGVNVNDEVRSRDLCIKGISLGKIVDIPKVETKNVLNSEFISNRRESIESIYESIVSISFLKETVENSESITNKLFFGGNEKLASLMTNIHKSTDISILYDEEIVEIEDSKKNIIIEYLKLNDKDIDEKEFFCIGNLRKRKQKNFEINNQGYSYFLVGKDNEKKKYNLIMQLFSEIIKYEQFVEYFTFIDSKYYLDLALCNIGRKYDEDIDVKVYLEKGMLCRKENIPIPGKDIVDTICDIIDNLLVIKQSPDLQPFDNYLFGMPLENYERILNYYFCFDLYEEKEYDVICFKQNYLKQNMNSCFPSVLILNGKIKKMKYEIISKYCPDVIVNELEIN